MILPIRSYILVLEVFDENDWDGFDWRPTVYIKWCDVSGYMTPIEDVDTVRTGAGGTHGHMDTMTTSMCPQIVQSYKDNNGHVVPGHRHQSHFEHLFICLW